MALVLVRLTPAFSILRHAISSWRANPNIEAVAAEHTTLLRASLAAASDTGLGALRELAITTERLTTLLVAITPEYFLFASLTPGALMGRARFALRLAGLALEREFE